MATFKEIKEARKFLLKKELEIKANKSFSDDKIALFIMKMAIEYCSVNKKKKAGGEYFHKFRSSFIERYGNLYYDVSISVEFCEKPEVTIITYENDDNDTIRQLELEKKIKSFF